MNKHDKMYAEIEKHGANLNAIFQTDFDNITLCKKLRRLEVKAHKLATDYCNGENGVDSKNWDAKCEPILKAVRKVLNMTDSYKHQSAIPIFINGDARGYALKIRDRYVSDNNLQIHKDWGGYGILAPDFSE